MHLYISDLDGTLLTPDAIVTPYTSQTIADLIERGLHFSVATARTLATVRQILDGVPVNVPVVLMNGACIYDLQAGRYIEAEAINPAARHFLFETLRRFATAGFAYTVDDNQMQTWYERIDTPAAKRYVAERVQRYGKVFTAVDDFRRDLADRSLVYYSITDREERLTPLYQELSQAGLMRVEFYRDVYNPGNSYLEVCATTASKYHAVKALRRRFKFDTITCFGDNVNDLPMFRASDIRYAVGNALPEVKAQADGVIGCNTEDGVARWLSSQIGGKETSHACPDDQRQSQ